MPNIDDIKYIKTNRNIRTRMKKDKVYSTIMNLFLNPPKKDKYYNTYSKTVIDYLSYVNNTDSNKSVTYIVDNILLKKLIYFKDYSHRYENNFQVYSQSWLYGALCSMRKYTMYNLIQLEQIPVIYDFNSPSSNGYYPLPKPMNNPAMIELGDKLYTILDKYADKYKIGC